MPFHNDAGVIQSLKDKFSAYLVKAADLLNDFQILKYAWRWWKTTTTDLPSWSAAVEKLVLVQPSSAAAERVFSLLVTMFGDQQHDALEDMIEAASTLRVNDRLSVRLLKQCVYWDNSDAVKQVDIFKFTLFVLINDDSYLYKNSQLYAIQSMSCFYWTLQSQQTTADLGYRVYSCFLYRLSFTGL